MLSIASVVLAAMFFAPPAPYTPPTEADVLEAPTRHIRTTDDSLRHLMRTGFRHSPTFADLVRRLQRSDVIVYVESVSRLPGAVDGRLMMLRRAHDYRYVRIQIALRGSPDDQIAVLGHELRHAVEVADAIEVGDAESMVKLYQRIGRRGGEHVYDTIAAQDTGRLIRRELSVA